MLLMALLYMAGEHSERSAPAPNLNRAP